MRREREATLPILAMLAFAGACTAASGPETRRTADGTAPNDVPGGAAGDGAPGGGTGPGGGASGDGSVDATPEPYRHFDINHVLSTGQSNSVSIHSAPVLTKTQPYGNLMFNVGVMTATGCERYGCSGYQKPSGFAPLVEGDVFWMPVETMSASLGNQITKISMTALAGTPNPRHDVLVSLHGRSGNTYACLRKGFCDWFGPGAYLSPFEEGMDEVADAKAIATAAGKSYVVRAVTAVHGESDHYAYETDAKNFPAKGTDGVSTVADYAEALMEWQRDYETGARAITGQTLAVPLFVSQYSHWNDTPHTKISFMQLDAHVRAPGKVIVIGPTYAIPYMDDCLHLTNHGYRQLGEYFAKAYARVILEGKRWEPLRPKSVKLAGNVINVTYLVPKPPIVLDTTRVTDPGAYGFEYADASGVAQAIARVEITGPDTVAVTLAAAPAGPGGRLRYAYTFPGCENPGFVPHGNVRDSDDTPSQNGYDLFNWSVHFDAPVE